MAHTRWARRVPATIVMETTTVRNEGSSTTAQPLGPSQEPQAPGGEPSRREGEAIGRLRIVNQDPKYRKAKCIEPTGRGYLYVAASVQPSPWPFVLPNAARARLVGHLKELAGEVAKVDSVLEATVFRAIVMPPTFRMSSYLRE